MHLGSIFAKFSTVTQHITYVWRIRPRVC